MNFLSIIFFKKNSFIFKQSDKLIFYLILGYFSFKREDIFHYKFSKHNIFTFDCFMLDSLKKECLLQSFKFNHPFLILLDTSK